MTANPVKHSTRIHEAPITTIESIPVDILHEAQRMVSRAKYMFLNSPVLLWGSVLAGCIALFLAYFLMSRGIIYNADHASILLEAQAMQQGNLLLKGWYIPPDDFITINIPFYALGLTLGFSMVFLMHIVPILLYTLVVMVGGYLTWTYSIGKHRMYCLLAFLGIVAFPPFATAQRLLTGPVHIGTILFTLIGVLAYHSFQSKEERDKLSYATVILLLFLTLVGDPFALVVFALPLIITEGIDAYVTRHLSQKNKALLTGTFLTILLSSIVRWLLGRAGLHIAGAGFTLADIQETWTHIAEAIVFILTLFHGPMLTKEYLTLLTIPLLINSIIVAALLYVTVRRIIQSFFQRDSANGKTTNLLLWGCIGVLAAFIVSTWGSLSGIAIYTLSSFLVAYSFFPFYTRQCVPISASFRSLQWCYSS